MNGGASKERRIFRLGTLLTGDAGEGLRILETVVGERGEVASLDPAHLDRLTILRSREMKSAVLLDALVPHDAALGLARMDVQQREAWILAHVDGMDDRDMARAMDCSRTATRRHLERAVEAWAATGIDPGVASVRLRAFAERLELPNAYLERRERRRRRRIALRIAIIASTLAIVGLGLFVIWRMTSQWSP